VATAAPGVAIVVAVTLLVWLAARRVVWALPILVVLTAADLGFWGIRFVYRDSPQTLADLTRGVPPAPAAPAESYAAAPARGPYSHDVLVLRGYRLANGYAGIIPASRHPLDGETSLALAGTRWTFTEAGVRQAAAGGVARVRLLDEAGRELTGSARLVADRPGHLVAEVDAPGRRVLAFTERFHHGWSATIDGAPLPMVRIEDDFLGCVVDAGVHRIVLQFRPRGFVCGSSCRRSWRCSRVFSLHGSGESGDRERDGAFKQPSPIA
jgi:hypothetical protein